MNVRLAPAIVVAAWAATFAGSTWAEESVRRPIMTADLVGLEIIGGALGTGLSASPDGRFVAFEMHRADAVANTYTAAWYVVPVTKRSRPITVGDAGDPLLFNLQDSGTWVAEAPVWSADSQWIYYRKRLAGQTQIWRSHRADDRSEQVTFSEADVESFTLDAAANALLFNSGESRIDTGVRRAQSYRTGHRVDVSEPWGRDGGPLERSIALYKDRPVTLKRFDLSSRSQRAATETEQERYRDLVEGDSKQSAPSDDTRSVARPKTGTAVAWLAPAFADQQGFDPPLDLFVSTSGRAEDRRRCTHESCRGYFEALDDSPVVPRYLWWNDEGTELVFMRRSGPNLGRRSWHAWDVKRDSVRQLRGVESEWLSSCVQAGTKALCFRETPTQPRVVVAIDLSSGRLDTVFDPNPQFAQLALGDVERLEWSDGRGHSTFGYLIKPLNYRPGTRYPLVIAGYRAPLVLQGGVGFEYPLHVLSANGFATLCYDAPVDLEVAARTLSPRERLFRLWDERLFDLKAPLSLLEAAIDDLVRRGLVDPRRVGIGGFSMGAHQANYALIASKRFSAAAVSHPPWSDIDYFLASGGKFQRELLQGQGFDPTTPGRDYALDAMSLVRNKEALRAPLLINTSDLEYTTGLETLIAFADAGKRLLEMHVYQDEYHAKWQPAHRLSVYDRNLDWFRFWLQSYEDPAAEKAEQYRGWREMREQLPTKVEGG